MKDLFPTMRSRSISSIAVGLVLIALCFSVGEGLRLTPFPVAQPVEPAAGSSIAGNFQVSVYGPLDVPTQSQKRGKRFAIEFACPQSPHRKEFFTARYSSSDNHSIAVASVLLVAFPSDRAPPLGS